jgi:hypothetical protein
MDNAYFTYSSQIDFNCLKQGDILAKTDELKELLSTVHPHYTSQDYTHFQVLTQSCDLVRRNGSNRCSSRYISLAAVRPMETVLNRFVESKIPEAQRINIDGADWCSDNSKEKMKEALVTIFNNNDKNLFFLKAVPEDGLTRDSCTFLHLSIAIKASKHYDTCLQAKKIELESNFQSKLGWLVGNLYSRVGTEDVVPGFFDSKKKFQEYVTKTLDNHILWVKKEQFSAFKKSYEDDQKKQTTQLLTMAKQVVEDEKESVRKGLLKDLTKVMDLNEGQQKILSNYIVSKQGSKYFTC